MSQSLVDIPPIATIPARPKPKPDDVLRFFDQHARVKNDPVLPGWLLARLMRRQGWDVTARRMLNLLRELQDAGKVRKNERYSASNSYSWELVD